MIRNRKITVSVPVEVDTEVDVVVSMKEIVDNMSPEEFMEALIDHDYDGFVAKAYDFLKKYKLENGFALDSDFDYQVSKLIGNSWRLSREDEETVMNIAKKII